MNEKDIKLFEKLITAIDNHTKNWCRGFLAGLIVGLLSACFTVVFVFGFR